MKIDGLRRVLTVVAVVAVSGSVAGSTQAVQSDVAVVQGAPEFEVVAMRLWRILDDYAVQTGGFAVATPMDVVFSSYDVVQPDIVFLTADSMRTVSLMDRVRQPPDLAVEVLSPSTVANDRGRKMRMFQRYGVPEYWIVDPIAETIEIYRLAESAHELTGTFAGGEEMRSAGLPNLTLVPSNVFPSRLP